MNDGTTDCPDRKTEFQLFFTESNFNHPFDYPVTYSLVLKMTRMRCSTRKSHGPPRGQSSPQSSAAPSESPPRRRKAAPAQPTRSVRQKVVQGKGKAPAPDSETEASDDYRSDEDTQSEHDSPARTEGTFDNLGTPPPSPVDLRLLSADDYAIKRHVNQYLRKADSINPRFHTTFQEQVYEQCYGRNRKFADHKWIKWSYLNDLDKYSGVYQLFRAVSLHDLVSFRQNYDDELIRQFYATVHVSADLQSLRWISVARDLQSTKEEFEQILNVRSSSWDKIFDSPALLAPAWSEYFDSNVKCKLGTITGLKPEVSMINRIINHTFYPKSGNFDAIRGHAWNIIDHIMRGVKFDVVDVILQGIVSSKNDRVKRIYYAPYIMALISQKITFRGGLGSVHKSYRPRDSVPPRPAAENDPIAEAVPTADPAIAEGSIAQILENQQLILSQLQEMKHAQIEFQTEVTDKLADMELVRDDFHNEVHNRMAAMVESIDDIEKLLQAPYRFAYTRRHHTSASDSAPVTPPAPAAQDPPPAPVSQDPSSAPPLEQVTTSQDAAPPVPASQDSSPIPAQDDVPPPQDPVV
ncbi:MAG: hypothetical protein ACRC4N_13955 [Gammaproteobacteria bacterium]